MRISDWSSDVCSSDLVAVEKLDIEIAAGLFLGDLGLQFEPFGEGTALAPERGLQGDLRSLDLLRRRCRRRGGPDDSERGQRARKSVVEGKRVSVRVALGGRRSIKKKKNNKPET